MEEKIIFNSFGARGGDGLPFGWFDDEDIERYRFSYESLDDEAVVVEVGVWQGRSICCVADIILKKNLKVYAVDTFLGSESARDVVHDCDGKLEDIFRANLEKFGLTNNVEVFSMDSVEASEKIRDKVDFVFIDGDHSAEFVRRDIFAWLPLVKKGGVLAGHDYDWVKDVVNDVLGERYKINTDSKNYFWCVV